MTKKQKQKQKQKQKNKQNKQNNKIIKINRSAKLAKEAIKEAHVKRDEEKLSQVQEDMKGMEIDSDGPPSASSL